MPTLIPPPLSSPTQQEFRQKVMLGTPFVVIWLVGFIADLDIDSWLMKGIMYAGVWVAVQFLSKYVPAEENTLKLQTFLDSESWNYALLSGAQAHPEF